MEKQHTKELKQTQSQTSQETSASAEVFTVNKIKQTDRNNEAVKNDSLEANTVSLPTQSELNADNTISKTTKSNATTADGGLEISDINSEDSNLQQQISDQSDVVSEMKRNEQVKKFTKSVSRFYSIEARQLYECDEEKCYDLALETIKNTQSNINAGKILIALAAHAAWSRTPAEKGGRRKNAAPGEGRMQVLEKFAADCQLKGVKISSATLNDYVSRVQRLVEDPLKQFKDESDEFIARERAESIDKLFLVPMGFLRIASQTTKPSEALAIACEKLANKDANASEEGENKDAKFTENQYKETVSHLMENPVDTKENGQSPEDSAPNSFDSEHSVERSEQGNDFDRSENSVKPSSFDKAMLSQINIAAQRANVTVEQAVEIHISILQAQLSIFKDMGVKK